MWECEDAFLSRLIGGPNLITVTIPSDPLP